jgi:nitrogen regulatory protein PII
MTDEDDMWLITAIIQPFKLDAVVLALQGLDEPVGMTVSDCRGFGRSKAPSSPSTSAVASIGADDVVDFNPKTRVEVALSDGARAGRVAMAIAHAAHTGRKGDGKVFISKLTEVIRIRTSDVGQNAL